MPDESRIPRKLNDYVQYMKRTASHLNETAPSPFTGKNWERFYWTETELEQWQSFAEKSENLFLLYSDPANRTTSIKDQLREVQSETVKYNQKQCLLNRIASLPHRTVMRDFFTFNIKRGTPLEKTKRTVHISSIEEQPMAQLKSIGGGIVKVACRTLHGSGRPHRHKLANSVQVAFSIGQKPPKDVQRCSRQHLSSQAKFFLRLDLTDQGKYIYFFARWYNTRHPELAGPWSGVYSAMIV